MSRSKDPQPRHEGYRLRRWIAAGLLGGIAVFNAGCTTEPRPTDSTSQAGSPSPSAGETTNTPAEFQSGATGQYAPDALDALADNEEGLVDTFRITGNTPQEIAENTQKALIGFLMSGTTKTNLDKYSVNGEVNKPDGIRYIEEVNALFGKPACEGMNGKACTFKSDIDGLHRKILAIYSGNHGNGPDTTLAPDFVLGADVVSDAKVVDGSIASGKVTIQFETQSTTNYPGSAAEKISNSLKGVDEEMDKLAAVYASVQNWGGHSRITQTYEKKAGGYWVIIDSSTERLSE